MTRLLLAGNVLLVGLLVFDRANRPRVAEAAERPAVRAAVDTPARVASRATPVEATPAVAPFAAGGGTPTIDLLARLEGRRRLSRATATTYFDSLFVETDSVLRRWVDGAIPLFVAVLPDSGRTDPELVALTRRALAAWEDAGAGIRFLLASDSSVAKLLIRGVPRLGGALVGETQLQWDQTGAIQSARITLARADSSGRLLSAPAALAVAIHEVGHALGLPHSPSSDDVMFSFAKAARLSQRDASTLALLYQLPLGSIRENAR